MSAVPALAGVVSGVPAAIPSPPRGVWDLGPIPVRAYALCIIAGIVVAVWSTERRFRARGGAPGFVTDVAVWAVPFGLVGGRLYHVATDWQTYFGPGGRPVEALYVWNGGLGIWGAIALGAVGAWIACRRHGVPLTAFADAAAPGIVVAQAIGRLGNWFNQELYGGPTTLPWGLEIYQRVDPDTGAVDNLTGVAVDPTPIAVVHPTFLYELLWNLLVAALVVWADRRFGLARGRAFALYVAGYTAGRFWIELVRTDPATRVFGDVRINVVVAAVVFLGAVAYLALVRGPREDVSGSWPDGAPEHAPDGGGSDADGPAGDAAAGDPDGDGPGDRTPVAAALAGSGAGDGAHPSDGDAEGEGTGWWPPRRGRPGSMSDSGDGTPSGDAETDPSADAASKEASAAIREQHGSGDPSGVDAAPADPAQEREEEAPVEPPSAAR